MAINFDNALGIHQYSVGVRERRAEVLASNIANADTPGFKARDLSFKDALASATQGSSFNLSKTSERHISGGRSMLLIFNIESRINPIPVTEIPLMYKLSVLTLCKIVWSIRHHYHF